MTPLRYARAASPGEAMSLAAEGAGAFLGGGTNLIDLMREGIASPSLVIDVTGLRSDIRPTEAGGLLVGAAASNAQLAEHPVVRAAYPVLTKAILAGASPQIRNMATVAGNLLQRTRCSYFYDAHGSRCNKRSPGEGCDALEGLNRYHAVLGASADCVATHPSDMAVAMMALDARLHLEDRGGTRTLPLSDFYRTVRGRPDIETALRPGELITAIELPPTGAAYRSTYRKVRDRASYAFALVSVAAVVQLAGGRIGDVRVALGGVAPRPWRASGLEAAVIGRVPSARLIAEATAIDVRDARPLADNAFKIALAQRTIVAVVAGLCGIDHGDLPDDR